MAPQLLCAISYSLKRLGAALYDEDEREIKIVLDLAEDNDFVMLSQLLRESRPTHILVNRSQDAEFQMFLRKECNHLMSNLFEESAMDPSYNDSTVPETLNISVMMPSQTQMVSSRISINSPQRASNKFNDESMASHFVNQSDANDEKEEVEDSLWHPTIHFLPDMAFSFGLSKNRIVQLFEDGVNDANMVASFRFDFSSTNMIRSLGALFRFLEQQKAGPQQKDENNQNINFNIRSCFDKINTYFLENCIEVDSATIRALEIFYSEYIPKSIRQKFVWGNNRREGMSLFKLCNVCRSTPGKQMLRMWFERPTKDMKVLTERHEAIAYLYQDCNLEITRGLRAFVKDISAVKGIFNRMRRGNAALTDWKNFFVTICTLVKIGKYLDEFDVKLPIFRGRHQCLGGRLQEVAALLTEVVDFQESSTENRIVILKGIDPDLDEKKDRYEHLPEELTEVAKMEAVDLNMDGCSVAYVPIIGYLLMLAETAPPLKSTSNFVELIFSSDGTSYYKTERMRMLDEELGDIKMQIVDSERNILMNLEKRLLQFRNIVLQAIGLGATLDCLISLASVARNFNWVRPTFVDKPSLFIEHARHPVAEHLCKSLRDFVPNPIFSSTDLGKIKILFGPNASGKSVYLKTVGTIVYMAHVGCFVPASRAIIGPINRIMSRIYSVDSVLDGMSSFANDLKQMSRAISRSDQNSLLIIDEFGKGTMTEVGLSLLASSLNYWLEGPIERCPHVVVASHFHSLPELLHDPNELVRFQTMGVSRLEDDSLEFHFNLMDGLTDLSYANFTALKMGIPRKVIDRAEEIYLHLRAGGTFTELAPIPLNQTALMQLTHQNEDYEYEEEDVEVEVEEEELIYEQE